MNWFKKYKLYIIPFVALYHYAWWAIYSGDPVETVNNILSSIYVFKYLFYVVFQTIGVYFCLYYLIPNFLKKGKFSQFFAGVIATIVVIASCAMGGYYLSAFLAGQDVFEMFKINPPSPLSLFKFNTLPSTISVFTLAMSIKLAKSWIETQQRSKKLEKEKLATELKFLRSQFNPHFLFNTINSVFFLIESNPVMATETLAKFSGLLRYQLYECNVSSIPLDREIDYIRSFTELEEIRLNHNFEICTYLPEGVAGNLVIAPFILMPFIENAFKHVSHHHDNTNWIRIEINLDGEELNLSVANSTSDVFKSSKHLEAYSGIGLQNVMRRLELLYPNMYELQVTQTDESYATALKLRLASSPRISEKEIQLKAL